MSTFDFWLYQLGSYKGKEILVGSHRNSLKIRYKTLSVFFFFFWRYSVNLEAATLPHSLVFFHIFLSLSAQKPCIGQVLNRKLPGVMNLFITGCHGLTVFCPLMIAGSSLSSNPTWSVNQSQIVIFCRVMLASATSVPSYYCALCLIAEHRTHSS